MVGGISIADDYISVAIFTILGVLFVWIAFLAARLMRPSDKTGLKMSTYECAEVAVGDVKIYYNVQYYLYVIVFLVFDVEIVFLYPWAAQFLQLGLIGFIEMLIFIGVLVIALAYAWGKGALEWIK